MTDQGTRALIAEARKRLFSDSEFGYEDTAEGDLIYRLASTLEARQVDEAVLTETVNRILFKYDQNLGYGVRDAVREIVEFLSERHEPEPVSDPLRVRIQQLIDNQQSWIDAWRSGQANSRDAVRDSLQRVLDQTGPVAPQPSESDVREELALGYVDILNQVWHHKLDVLGAAYRIAGLSRTAAPAETEWEYVGQVFEANGFMRYQNDQLTPEKFYGWRKLMTRYPRVEIWKRSKAGPWLPVPGGEGESGGE